MLVAGGEGGGANFYNRKKVWYSLLILGRKEAFLVTI
jgi:hypothetical protein